MDCTSAADGAWICFQFELVNQYHHAAKLTISLTFNSLVIVIVSHSYIVIGIAIAIGLVP